MTPKFDAGSGGRVCDVRDRIIIVDGGVTVLERPTLRRTNAPITRSEHLPDRCDSPAGGHAGCSIHYERFWSSALGTSYVEFGTNPDNHLGDEGCREWSSYRVIATCSTASHFILVKYVEPATGDCYHLQATIWDLGDHMSILEGDVDRADSTAKRWVYRFSNISLAFTPSGATLEVDGVSDRCVAFRLSLDPESTR